MLLREILKLEVFNNSRVLAGESLLDINDVQSVTILEVTSDEVVHWIKGGELFLSCLYAVSNDVDQQVHVLRLLRSRNASGLIICSIGYFLHDVSPRLVSEANAIGLPIIVMPPEITYEEILRPLLSALLNIRYNDLSVILQIQRTMNLMALRREDIHTILRFLMDVLNKEIAFLDNDNNLICGGRDIHDELPRSFYQIPDKDDSSNILYERHCLRYAAIACDCYYGSIIVFGVEQSEIERIQLILSNTLQPIMLVNMRKTNRFFKNELNIKNFFYTLRDRGFRNISDMFESAERIGISIYGKHRMIMIHFEKMIGRGMIQETQRLISMENQQNESFAFDDNLILILASRDNYEEDMERIKNLYQSIFSLLKRHGVFRMSISTPYEDAVELENAYHQILLTLNVGEKIYPDLRCISYHDLGIYGLLYTNYHLSQEGAGVHRDILKLREHDIKHGGRLVDTLQMLSLAQENENIETIAKEMNIHKNTLLYRKNKIVEFLGHDPFSMPMRFNYQAYFLAEKLGAKD
jgi:purine catabolism regulator